MGKGRGPMRLLSSWTLLTPAVQCHASTTVERCQAGGHLLQYMSEYNTESAKQDRERFNSHGRQNTLPILVYYLSMVGHLCPGWSVGHHCPGWTGVSYRIPSQPGQLCLTDLTDQEVRRLKDRIKPRRTGLYRPGLWISIKFFGSGSSFSFNADPDPDPATHTFSMRIQIQL